MLAVSGVHGSGKTTLLEKLLPILRGRGLKLVTGNQYMEAVLATDEQAELLQIPKGAAVLHIERHVSDELGRPVEATYSVYRGDQYRLFIEFDSIG